jgi:hypothetical protein
MVQTTSLKEALMKLYGLGQYSNPMNILYGDGFYANWIYETWSEEEVNKCLKELKKTYNI